MKIWDTKFNLVTKVNLRDCSIFERVYDSGELSPQSIDVYLCKMKTT